MTAKINAGEGDKAGHEIVEIPSLFIKVGKNDGRGKSGGGVARGKRKICGAGWGDWSGALKGIFQEHVHEDSGDGKTDNKIQDEFFVPFFFKNNKLKKIMGENGKILIKNVFDLSRVGKMLEVLIKKSINEEK